MGFDIGTKKAFGKEAVHYVHCSITQTGAI
jgi:hypothetical protein